MEARAVAHTEAPSHTSPQVTVPQMIDGYSIEVMPRTAAKIESFRDLLPNGTRVYIACVEGTEFSDMLATAKRIRAEGFEVMPHLPARLIPSLSTLEDWLRRYRDEADIHQALLLGGGVKTPVGDLDSSLQMIESGLFDKLGFKRLHVAGHPEGNADIDRDGSSRIVDAAILTKQAFSERTDADMAITTQFFFDAKPVIAWADRLRDIGVTLPIHVGIAGPTKLQTLLKFAVACGVGPSVKVLRKRAMDLSKLMLPYEPTDVLADLAAHQSNNPNSGIAQVHFFPLGGIKATVQWASDQTSVAARAGAA